MNLDTNWLNNLGIVPTSLPVFDVPVDLLKPMEGNPNEMDDKTFNRLVQEINESGFVEPLQIAPCEGEKFIIVGGEHRYNAVITLGWEKVPCILKMEWDRDIIELLNVRLNVIRGRMNGEKFRRLYDKVAERYGSEQLRELFGFTDSDAWKKLLGGVEDALKQSGVPGEALDKIKKKVSRAKNVDGLGKVLKKFFESHSGDLSHGFMIFSHGGKSHVYIEMDDKLFHAIEAIMGKCRSSNRSISDFVYPAIVAAYEEANARNKSKATRGVSNKKGRQVAHGKSRDKGSGGAKR